MKNILFYILLGAVMVAGLWAVARNDQQVLNAQYNYPEVVDYK